MLCMHKTLSPSIREFFRFPPALSFAQVCRGGCAGRARRRCDRRPLRRKPETGNASGARCAGWGCPRRGRSVGSLWRHAGLYADRPVPVHRQSPWRRLRRSCSDSGQSLPRCRGWLACVQRRVWPSRLGTRSGVFADTLPQGIEVRRVCHRAGR